MWHLEVWRQNRAQQEVAGAQLRGVRLEAGGGVEQVGEVLGQDQGLGGGLVLRGLGF